jgi:hypothetical protein
MIEKVIEKQVLERARGGKMEREHTPKQRGDTRRPQEGERRR